MQKITPFLWFDNQAGEAARFYTSIFKHSKLGAVSRFENTPGPDGTVMIADFELEGQAFSAFNGGPAFKFTEAISFVVLCDDQAEVDHLWEKLSAGGEKSQCGWLKDKFGVSWQIVPKVLNELLSSPDPVRADRVMQAMLKMNKLDIEGLKQAAEQK
jgi:predicted 3-demethylubiquinone-9 3-methyltransferase (glyoxalase superfamily)